MVGQLLRRGDREIIGSIQRLSDLVAIERRGAEDIPVVRSCAVEELQVEGNNGLPIDFPVGTGLHSHIAICELCATKKTELLVCEH